MSSAIVAETNIEESDFPMLAGKTQKLANVAKKRPVLATLCCLLLVFSLAGFAFSTPADVQPNQPELFVITRNMQTYDLDATQWNFPMLLAGFGSGPGTARLVEFSIDGHDLLPLVPKSNRTISVLRVDNEIDSKSFERWNNYRRRAAVLRVRDDERISFTETEEHEFRGLTNRIIDISDRRRDTDAPQIAEITVAVSDLPFKVAAGDYYHVKIAVERGRHLSVSEGEILIVDVEPLATNPIWVPADLHIHSTFGDPSGRNTPAQLASLLAGKGYRIGYVTDEPAGWNMSASTIPPTMGSSGWHGIGAPRATWDQYRTTVRNASTVQVAMFPGLEISASTLHRTYSGIHNGHALAYGIQNLTGSGIGTFETTGLRYNWFRPNELLHNININNPGSVAPGPGPSSAAIAHPTIGHPWNPLFLGVGLTERYDGFELMTAGQGLPSRGGFGPNALPMEIWRSELVHRLPGVFTSVVLGGGNFPSARTGSDWGNHWFTDLATDISYYTYIGITGIGSLPADMRTLSQVSVNRALRAGRTVASRLGGFATLRLRNAQGSLQELGSWFNLPIGATVSGEIVFRAAVPGNYRIRIIENSSGRSGLADTRHDSLRHVNAGQTVTIPVSFRFEGGQRSYHVIVEDASAANDFIYTSPIFIRQ